MKTIETKTFDDKKHGFAVPHPTYKAMKSGEIVQKNDQYISVHSGQYVPVAKHTVGQPLFECNAPYYRRPICKK